MNISSIFYFSKSTSKNTQYSSLWDTLEMMLFTKYLLKWKRIGRISWKFCYWCILKSSTELDIYKDKCDTCPMLLLKKNCGIMESNPVPNWSSVKNFHVIFETIEEKHPSCRLYLDCHVCAIFTRSCLEVYVLIMCTCYSMECLDHGRNFASELMNVQMWNSIV